MVRASCAPERARSVPRCASIMSGTSSDSPRSSPAPRVGSRHGPHRPPWARSARICATIFSASAWLDAVSPSRRSCAHCRQASAGAAGMSVSSTSPNTLTPSVLVGQAPEHRHLAVLDADEELRVDVQAGADGGDQRAGRSDRPPTAGSRRPPRWRPGSVRRLVRRVRRGQVRVIRRRGRPARRHRRGAGRARARRPAAAATVAGRDLVRRRQVRAELRRGGGASCAGRRRRHPRRALEALALGELHDDDRDVVERRRPRSPGSTRRSAAPCGVGRLGQDLLDDVVVTIECRPSEHSSRRSPAWAGMWTSSTSTPSSTPSARVRMLRWGWCSASCGGDLAVASPSR